MSACFTDKYNSDFPTKNLYLKLSRVSIELRPHHKESIQKKLRYQMIRNEYKESKIRITLLIEYHKVRTLVWDSNHFIRKIDPV